MTAQVDFEVRREEEHAIQTALAGLGDEFSRMVTRVPENENAVQGKVHVQATLINLSRIPPREITTLGIEAADVDAAATLFASLVNEAGGRMVESRASRERTGKVTAKLVFDVPLAAAADLANKFKTAGVVRVLERTRNPQVSEGPLTSARLDVTLSNSDLIVPTDEGLWPQVRKGLSTSFIGLSWSVTVLIIGMLFVLPWALAIYIGWRLLLWVRRRPA